MKEVIFTFQIFGEYCKLMLAIDISLLDNLIGHFNTNAMDFFRLWFFHFHNIDSQQIVIICPHLWDILKYFSPTWEKGV